MWRVLFILTVLTATCEPYSKKPKTTTPNRNQRIIKVQGPPHFNHFHGHQKPIRKRPFGAHHGEEFIRPNHPPFFNGPSTNHVKHLPRPPPHVFHKAPSYGLGFPYKSLTNYRPTKDAFRLSNAIQSSISTRPVISSSSGTGPVTASSAFHSSSFASSSFLSQPPVSHIISSDDNNGPIREIPAPNLGPKHHEASFGDLGGIGGIGGIGGLGAVKIHTVSLHGGSGIHGYGGGIGGSFGGSYGGVLGGSGGSYGGAALGGSGGIHGASGGIYGGSGIGGSGGIHTDSGIEEISNLATVGGVTHLDPHALLNSVAKNPKGVNLDAIVKDQGLEVNTYIKETSSELGRGKETKVEIANFDEGTSIDVTNLIKEAAGTSDHHSGYEVTEHNDHLPSNDQIIKGHDGTKAYYAPDPDPSLPVHKVPPTNDPHSTPSNGQNINNVYLPQVSHGFPYVQGGSVGSSLSSQELFQLMHGYPTVLSQPVVAFVGQPQVPGVILSGGGQNYFQQGGHYGQDEQGGNDIGYLQQSDVHGLLHRSPESSHEEVIGGSHSSVVSQSVYSPQNQYQNIQSQYRTSTKNSDNFDNSDSANYPTSEINHNFQFEPEASESNNRNSLTVIRQTDEGSLNSEKVKELLLEDSVKYSASENVPTILQLKNIPEVPFYASLPSQKAAEALAGLQAAGSIASNYVDKLKISRKDSDEQNEKRRRKLEDMGKLFNEVTSNEEDKTVVEVQKSVPLYETSITSKNLVEPNDEKEESTDGDVEFSSEGSSDPDYSNLDLKPDGSSESFGKRIRPK